MKKIKCKICQLKFTKDKYKNHIEYFHKRKEREKTKKELK